MRCSKPVPRRVDSDPIGTGPFKLAQYQKDSRILYTAFPDYWQGKAKIDRLVLALPGRFGALCQTGKNECRDAIS